jgi:hypothetical protein
MADKEYNWFIFYRDKGPVGTTVQCMSITSSWKRLYRFTGTYNDLRSELDFRLGLLRGKRARVEIEFFLDDQQAGKELGFDSVKDWNNEG